ncbi:MAG: guanylate kinase [Bacteroidales bacterium]|nr:guanylate kinase [Bacteroidales bacterium]
MNTVYCIVGPSGVGKTTAVEWASKALNIGVVRSYTTRPMRPGEVDGIDHIFVNCEDMPERSEMAAYTYFGGNHYWATMKQCTENDVFYVIDEKGLFELQEKIGNKARVVTIYITGERETETERANRDQERIVIPREKYDVVIENNGSLESFLYQFTKEVEKLKSPL